jgi:ATP-dependent Zn protease
MHRVEVRSSHETPRLERVSTAPDEKPNYKKYMPGGETPMPPEARRRILIIAVVAFLIGILIIPSLFSSKSVKTISYSTLIHDARGGDVISAAINNNNGVISGQLTNGTNYTSNGPIPAIADEVNTLRTNNVNVTFAEFLPYLIWILIFGRFHLLRESSSARSDERHDVGGTLSRQAVQ